MGWVEQEHGFPAQLEDFHNRRCAWLFEQGLGRDLTMPVTVVAGSCGKASTARFLAFIVRALLDATGETRPLGLGTKPPLQETLQGNRERYQLFEAGQPVPRWIAPQEFTRLAAQLQALVEGLPAELGPLAAYDLRYWLLGRFFVEQQVAFGIVEANIGLRLDPASVFPEPALALLTPIGNDHGAQLKPDGAPDWLALLGDRAGPTWHKAGGLPPGAPVVVGRQTIAVEQAIARLHPRNLTLWERDYEATEVVAGTRGTTMRLRLGEESFEVRLSVVGRFQADNAAQAAAGAWVLWKEGKLPGTFAQLRQAVVTGLERADTPGRLQLYAQEPTTYVALATGFIKVDTLMKSLEELLDSHHPESRLVVCLTFLDRIFEVRRSFERILESPRLEAAVVTSFFDDDENRDLAPEVLAGWAAGSEVRVCPDPGQAVETARRLAHPERDLVLLLGNGLCHSLDLSPEPKLRGNKL